MNEPKTGTSLPSRKNLSNCGSAAYGSRMRFKVLGPLEVTGPNGPISLGGPKQRAVLAHLLVRTNELDAFRFDTSDLIPVEIGQDAPWGGDAYLSRRRARERRSHPRRHRSLVARRLRIRQPGASSVGGTT